MRQPLRAQVAVGPQRLRASAQRGVAIGGLLCLYSGLRTAALALALKGAHQIGVGPGQCIADGTERGQRRHRAIGLGVASGAGGHHAARALQDANVRCLGTRCSQRLTYRV